MNMHAQESITTETNKEEHTGFSLGNLVVGGGNLTIGPSRSSVEGKLKRQSAIA